MNNKTNNRAKRFPNNKYKLVHEFLYNAYYNKLCRPNEMQPKKIEVLRIQILNKEIHLDNGSILKIALEKVTNTHFIVFTDTSKVPRRIYDLQNLYTTITKEDFYALYHTLKHSYESIIFQLTL